MCLTMPLRNKIGEHMIWWIILIMYYNVAQSLRKCPLLLLVDNNSATNICVFVMGFIDYYWNSWFVCIGVDVVRISRLSWICSCRVFVFLLFHLLQLAHCFVWSVNEFIILWHLYLNEINENQLKKYKLLMISGMISMERGSVTVKYNINTLDLDRNAIWTVMLSWSFYCKRIPHDDYLKHSYFRPTVWLWCYHVTNVQNPKLKTTTLDKTEDNQLPKLDLL